MHYILLHQLLDLHPSNQSSTDALHTTTPTARYSTMHIYSRHMDLPKSIEHICLTYNYTQCYISHNCIYIKGRHGPHQVNRVQMLYILPHELLYLDTSIQLSTDALHTAKPSALYSIMHIYVDRWTPPVN